MIIEQKIVDKIEILHTGDIQVREANQVVKDGVVIASSYHRRTISIFETNPDLSWLDEGSQAVVRAARTPERMQKAQELLSEQNDVAE